MSDESETVCIHPVASDPIRRTRMIVKGVRRDAGKRGLVGVGVHRTGKGYTLTLHRGDGIFPVLDAAREPKRWRNLDHALAFLVENFGIVSPIHLNLQDE